jgi:hypothetical protein
MKKSCATKTFTHNEFVEEFSLTSRAEQGSQSQIQIFVRNEYCSGHLLLNGNVFRDRLLELFYDH